MQSFARRVLLAEAMLAIALSQAAAADLPRLDVPGGTDSPFLARGLGARIIAYDQSDDDEATLPSGPYRDFGFTGTVKLEGRITRIAYAFTQQDSSISIMNHVRDQLKGAGFVVMFACAGHDGCGGFSFGEALTQPMAEAHGGEQGNRIIDFLNPVGGDIRYVLATLRRPQGRVTLAVAVARAAGREPGMFVETAEQPPASTERGIQDAALLASALRVRGHVVVGGIHFRAGRSTITPDSRPALAQVASMLHADPTMKLIVVDHSEGSASLKQALQLSQARAEAVMQALISRGKVQPSQLDSLGVGPAAPIASNADEAGRSFNRRIELVLE